MRTAEGLRGMAVVLLLSLPAASQDDALDAPPAVHLDRAKLRSTVERALSRKGGFCKAPGARLEPEDRNLCDLSAAAADRCPGFSAACSKRPVHPRSIRLRSPGGTIGEFFATVLDAAFWAVFVFGVLFVLRALALSLARWRLERKAVAVPHERDMTSPTVERPSLPEDPAILLARARELGESGHFGEAMALGLRALLRALEVRGELDLHPSRTNGEYARCLRTKPALAYEFCSIAGEVEAVQFGGRSLSRRRFSAWVDQVASLIGSGAANLMIVSLTCFAVGCSTQDQPGTPGLRDCGLGASGHSVLCELLSFRGSRVHRRYTRLEEPPEDVDQVIIVGGKLAKTQQGILLDWVSEGGRLVEASAHGELLEHVDVGVTGQHCGDRLDARWLSAPRDAVFILPGAATFRPTVETFVLARCKGAPFALRVPWGEGEVVAVADRRFFTNAGLSIADNAELANLLLGPRADHVELRGDFTGSGSTSPLHSVAAAGLLPWVVHVMLLGLGWALYRGSPFGSRRDPGHAPRREFREHVEALGEAYARARASEIALFYYGSYVLDRLRVRSAISSEAQPSMLAASLAAQTGVPEPRIYRLLIQVRSAGEEGHDPVGETEQLAALRQLVSLSITTRKTQ